MFQPTPDNFARLAACIQLITRHQIKEQWPLEPFRWEQADGSEKTIPYGHYWGDTQQHFTLHNHFQVPSHWPDSPAIALDLQVGDYGDAFQVHPEALVWIDGEVAFAIDPHHTRWPLAPHHRDGKRHTLRLQGWTGLGPSFPDSRSHPLYLDRAALVLLDLPTQDYGILARNLLEAAQHLPPDHPQARALFHLLHDNLHQVHTRHPLGDRFYGSIPPALEALKQAIAALGDSHPFTIHSAGHGHLDVAWLWTLGETRGKALRTFTNALALMAEFPDYHFSQSQPQLYEYVREDHPPTFARIQKAVAAGRWEPLGAMWVEADCNLAGAESLARQFLLGDRYLRQHFGDRVAPVLWLPDTFGYPATLPQLMAEADIPYFFTTKLRWNEENQFPHDSFWWVGPDGSRVLTHITPTPMQSWLRMATYNAIANAQALVETWERQQQKDPQGVALMVYGWGDGGGGPDRTMLENLTVLPQVPGLPQVQQGTVANFFHRLAANHGPQLPQWQGELYLETHQGTFTSQAWIKRANRLAERRLHDLEFVAVWAALHSPDYGYPHGPLESLWRSLLLHQFHDILPGSSIGPVYDEAKIAFRQLQTQGENLQTQALKTLVPASGPHWHAINTTSFERSPLVCLPQSLAGVTRDGQPCTVQPTPEGTLVYGGPPISPFGVATFSPGPPQDLPSSLVAQCDRLENDQVVARFNDRGDLVALIHKASGWNLISEGAIANEFQLFEDRPLRYDAWNIDPDFERSAWVAPPATEITVEETGPVRATLRIRRPLGEHSTLDQRISLHCDRPDLLFHTRIHWQERHTLLKVAFPVSTMAPEATYHIQWGSVRRPTHKNTPWDRAKYECVAHHWADLGTATRGVTLLNDCKYGHDVHGQVMRLTLLKGSTYPDPQADLGDHEFTYGVRPRFGDLGAAFQGGYDLNYPLLVHPGDRWRPQPLITDLSGGMVVETVKQSEDGGAIMVRLYEPLGQPQQSHHITWGFPVAAAWRSNIQERAKTPLTVEGDRRIRFDMGPHQLLTLRIEPQSQDVPGV